MLTLRRKRWIGPIMWHDSSHGKRRPTLATVNPPTRSTLESTIWTFFNQAQLLSIFWTHCGIHIKELELNASAQFAVGSIAHWTSLQRKEATMSSGNPALSYGDCVSSLRTSLCFLESSVATLGAGVQDFPRLSSVLKTVRVRLARRPSPA